MQSTQPTQRKFESILNTRSRSKVETPEPRSLSGTENRHRAPKTTTCSRCPTPRSPDREFDSSELQALSTATPCVTSGTPYLHVGGAPAMAHSIPSPIRLFTPSDMVLGRRGTALWLDAQAYEGGHAQAGDHGQRIAGRMLAAPSSSFSSAGGPGGSGGGDAAEGGGEGGDRVSPGWFGEERAGGGAMVFHMQKEDDGWNRLALDEEEGRIAVGTVYGRVHLFEYAPQGELAL